MNKAAIGRYLRETREAQELTLEQAVNALKIRHRVLEAFEAGEFDTLGLSPVQVRGFIRSYARYLGLDDNRLVAYYHVAHLEEQEQATRKQPRKQRNRRGGKQDQTQPTAPTRPATPPVPTQPSTPRVEPSPPPVEDVPIAAKSITDTDPSLPSVTEPTYTTLGDAYEFRRRRRRSNLNRTVLLLIAAAAIAIIIFVVVELLQVQAAVDIETLPDIITSPTATPTFTPLPTSTSVREAMAPTERSYIMQNYDGTGVAVSVLMQQRTWVRFVVDGEERYVGVARPDEALEAQGIEQIEVSATNAEALLVTYNGQPQRLLGQRGQRVDIIFTPDRMDVSSGNTFGPTSEFTATQPPTSQVDVEALIQAQTPSNTPGPSPTPSLTFTPSNTPTVTPLPTNTPTLTNTVGPSPTSTPTATLTLTLTPSDTPEPSITPTPSAVLPLRETQANLTPTKNGA